MKKVIFYDGLHNGKEIEREIKELSDEEIKNCKYLGKSVGLNIGHCLSLANKYCKDFIIRVYGFKEIENDSKAKIYSEVTKQNYIAVEFFEKTTKAI